ncbi:MAG: hypothetical protein AAF611_19015 [Bacteroidota bacterium]
MNIDRNVIKSFTATVAKEAKVTSTSKIHIKIEVETTLKDAKIKDFQNEDIYNLTILDKVDDSFKLLKLNIYVVPNSREIEFLEKPQTIKNFFVIDKKNKAEFEFDIEENSIFLMEVKVDIFKPEGTKRRVITYEDSDDIDEGIVA